MSLPTLLEQLSAECPPVQLELQGLFLAWSGVLTLAYRPLPSPLLQLKQQLAQRQPNLLAENPGSRWPKTTLAVLNSEQPLSQNQAKALQAWLKQQRMPALPPIVIQQLDDLAYDCRSLERYHYHQSYPLTGTPSLSLPTWPEHQAEVEQVWQQADKPDYWQALCRSGNRAAHYRSPCQGRSLIIQLPAQAQVTAWLQQVQLQLEHEFPSLYCWFEPSSRHLTLRALDFA